MPARRHAAARRHLPTRAAGAIAHGAEEQEVYEDDARGVMRLSDREVVRAHATPRHSSVHNGTLRSRLGEQASSRCKWRPLSCSFRTEMWSVRAERRDGRRVCSRRRAGAGTFGAGRKLGVTGFACGRGPGGLTQEIGGARWDTARAVEEGGRRRAGGAVGFREGAREEPSEAVTSGPDRASCGYATSACGERLVLVGKTILVTGQARCRLSRTQLELAGGVWGLESAVVGWRQSQAGRVERGLTGRFDALVAAGGRAKHIPFFGVSGLYGRVVVPSTASVRIRMLRRLADLGEHVEVADDDLLDAEQRAGWLDDSKYFLLFWNKILRITPDTKELQKDE
ncbi:hypothetical protein B0H10DRAFT_2191750 [Mycena sp. CBHHK59/15]|nr:hypothetical protein B0H10DRAFT_2191750 [Mycena sp. CBHHK59/15]